VKWVWGSLADAKLSALLNTPMKALENYLGRAERERPVTDVIRTADATVTTLRTVVVPVNQTLVLSGYVCGRRTAGSAGSTNDGAGYRVEFVAKNTSGTAALIGAGAVTALGESQGGWDITLSASGGTILVRVTGAANNNVVWVGSFQTLLAKE
jgi:hypothetical protein